MKSMNILLPLQCGCDNRSFFAFAMQFAKQTQAKLNVLTTYNIPFDYMLSHDSYLDAVENEKERIQLQLLELIGFYECLYNRWDPAGKVNIKTLIKEGSFEDGLISELKSDSDFVLLLNQEYFQNRHTNSDLVNKLIRSKIKILSIASDDNYYLTDPYLSGENNEINYDAQFEKVLMNTEIYNMPADINLFRRDAMMAS